jgi:hypothetical protein
MFDAVESIKEHVDGRLGIAKTAYNRMGLANRLNEKPEDFAKSMGNIRFPACRMLQGIAGFFIAF